MRAKLLTTLLLFTMAASIPGLHSEEALAQGRGGGRARGGGGGFNRAGGPTGQAVSDSLSLRRHGFSALAVSAHPWSTVVAVTVVIPGGSGGDPAELSGASWLLGQAVRDALEGTLARSDASISVAVDRTSTRFQMIAAPGAWRTAYEAMTAGIFSEAGAYPTLQSRRTEAEEVFRFERGAPVREFQRELALLIGGSSSSWSRDSRGTSESVQRVTASDLNALRRRTYVREDAVVTIVGALDAAPGIVLYAGAGDGQNGGRRAGSGAAWSTGRQQRLTRPVTSTWIGAAFPARRDASRTVLEFLVDRLRDDLNPSPRDPGLFGTQVRIEDLPAGPAIVLEAVVLPEDQVRWVERITRAMRAIEDRYDDAYSFGTHQRHFRNARLVEESAPEAEGVRIAMDLMRSGRARDLREEIEELSAEDIVRGINSLGQPRILVFGPDLGR